MYVYFNGKRVSWYIPGVDPDQTVKLDTATFTPKMLPKGRIEQGGNSPPLIVIPDVPNRISTRKDCYIELILSRHYDKEAHQSRNKKVIIGQDASGFLPGMMFPNDNYFDYFDHSGRLINDPMQAEEANEQIKEQTKEKTKAKEAAEKAKEKEETEPTDPKAESRTMNQQTEQKEQTQPESQTQSRLQTQQQEPQSQPGLPKHQPEPQTQSESQAQPTPVTDEALTTREQAIKEKETELAKKAQKLLAIQQQLAQVQEQQLMEQNEALKDHVYLLSRILKDYIDAIEQQVKRKPDTPMSLKQIRIINEVLQELRDIFTGSESDPFLHLAEEPDSDHDNPGTTYGEMNLLLSAYYVTANTFHYGGLRTKKR